MIDTLLDAETLENAIIAFEEGASDERRMALDSLRGMLTRKRTEIMEFEAWCDEQASIQNEISMWEEM